MNVERGRKPKLVVFDVEGVLVPKNRLFFDVGKSLGVLALFKILVYGFLYEVGALRLRRALRGVYGVARGVRVEFLLEVLDKMPFLPSAVEVFCALKSEGCKTALVSSGVPTRLVEHIASIVGADYAVGVEIGVKDGALTGEIWGDVTEQNGKVLVLKELVEAENLRLEDCVVVADDRNNASIYLKDIQKIGYNPDFMIRYKADVVVTGKLTKILPIIHGETKTKPFPSHKDLLRESIHMSGFLVPIVAMLIGVPLMTAITLTMICVYAISEFLRLRGTNMPLISTITRHAASNTELCEFALAPIYFAVGIMLTLLIFPAPTSSAAIAMFALGDSTASLFGGTLSKKPMPFNRTKTLEGTLAGFFFAFLAGTVFVSPWIALVGAVTAMAIEYLPLPVNDNLLIPLGTGLLLVFLV
ncbi:MAG: HAD-IB family phosphatase [Candidatus Bathyarchaeota archaeon]|nr:HAD-IB family phosphatase [Candidatus Bathyarchaeota archaeon]